ncbi:MAG TPA: 1-acyl-sn-glycerol-3-phosphate acyltransferase [Gemmatimonadaceae bacterium]|nr:1-acyl-sn-glycerol-3-phosphate acyltransferase [Gemmatimonadaceae bacterium]
MWLLPHLPAISGAAIRAYYRASRDGGSVPATGPVLLVANHPNALLDPALLAWAARRPVRFLAKAPLFTHPIVGWLIRGSGSLPVYRAQDDPALMDKNEDTFRAVFDALAAGSAAALFPEGISHSEPGMTPLKTGAARIALGSVARTGVPFPIIPIGLVFREKDVFRSDAHAVVGAPIEWSDIAMRGAEDREAVRELTDRIDRGMRAITLNLARWEDEPVVRTAEAVWAVSRKADPSPSAHVARLTVATDGLAKLRAREDKQWDTLARDVREHARLLDVLRVAPADVEADNSLSTAGRWAFRRFTLLGALQFTLAALAMIVFWIPYRVTDLLASAVEKTRAGIATYRVIGGVMVFGVWTLLAALVIAGRFGWLASGLSLVVLPALGIAGLYAVDHWRDTIGTARRWMTLRRRDPRIGALRERQRELADRLDAALAALNGHT